MVTQFMAVTVQGVKTVPLRATGSAVAPVSGLPTVTVDANGEPGVFIPKSKAPANLVAQPLIQGDGAKIGPGKSVLVHYSAWLWKGAELVDSTWKAGAATSWRLSSGKTLPGLIQGLVGQTVGSQLLLVVPPQLGFGEAGTVGIPGGSTLVYVVDVLDVS
jgi:peptidylprolyl isomerase